MVEAEAQRVTDLEEQAMTLGDVVSGVVTVCAVFLGFAIGSVQGRSSGMESVRRDAIQNGAAEWRADPASGAATFAWKTPATQPAR